jgi:acetylornithine deacetylase
VADITAVLSRLRERDPDLNSEVELMAPAAKVYMPAFEVDSNHPFVRNLVAVHREVSGQEPRVGDVAPYKFYGTDAAHLSSRAGMIGLVYGPGGKYNTMPDERVEIADIVTAAKVYALMIIDTCGVVE